MFQTDSGHEYSFNTKTEALAVKDPDGLVTQTLEKQGGQDILVLKRFQKDGKRLLAMTSLQIDPIGQTMSLGEQLSAEGQSISFLSANGDKQSRPLVFAAPEQRISLNDLTGQGNYRGYMISGR